MYNILVETTTGLIKYYDKDFTLFNNVTIVSSSGNVDFVVSDMNASNCNVFQVVNPIIDFVGNKYLYVNGEVVDNPDYIELEIPEV